MKVISREYVVVVLLALVIYSPIHAAAINNAHATKAFITKSDTSGSTDVQSQIAIHRKDLYFPGSVERFYKQTGFKLAWIASDTVKTHAAEAMLLLDCVLQYGLNHSDYHPLELLYDKLNRMTEKGNSVSSREKARFDIMLTDAMIAFMNNLHYGKLNPDYPAEKIDAAKTSAFRAEILLTKALQQKSFMYTIESSQPRAKEYASMQDRLRLLIGQYQADCYEIPKEDVQKLAINMERIRWANMEGTTYIHINIPSYTLKFHKLDSLYLFKVIVGKPANPTPTLQSAIDYFTTAPYWRVPKKIMVKEILPKALKNSTYMENSHFSIFDRNGRYIVPSRFNLLRVVKNPDNYSIRQSAGCDNSLGLIVFRFPNIYDIYLHDTPEQQLFAKPERGFSHGCIRVEQAEKLATLLLKYDGAANQIASMHTAITALETRTFTLKKTVPIKVTYLTCEVNEGVLTTYKDIYNLDKNLELALYDIDQSLTSNNTLDLDSISF